MLKHELKTCPRCGRTFECKANNPVRCNCALVELDEERLDAMQRRYSDCLCLDCLRAIAAGHGPAGDSG
jgi:hypothetical protein